MSSNDMHLCLPRPTSAFIYASWILILRDFIPPWVMLKYGHVLARDNSACDLIYDDDPFAF